MRCQAPGCLNQAKVHFTQLEEGKKEVEIHLCEKCAEKQGVTTPPQHVALQQILASLEIGSASDESAEAQMACPRCGITLGEFRSTGRLGCGHDYEQFRNELESIIERVHDDDQHRGKVPSRAGEAGARRQRIDSLNRDLRKSVESEQYERAAAIRDEIRRLEGSSE